MPDSKASTSLTTRAEPASARTIPDPIISYDDEFGGIREFNVRISRITIRRMMRAGTWPPAVRWSAQRIGWFQSILIAHFAARPTTAPEANTAA